MDEPEDSSRLTDDEGRMDPARVYHWLRKKGLLWADNESARTLYEETKKTVLARLTLHQQELSGGKISGVEAERRALASNEYSVHLSTMADAVREALRAKVEYDSGRAAFEAARSRNAMKRTEIENLKVLP